MRQEMETCLVAALCSEVWQKRKRSSFRLLVKTYLPDMVRGSDKERDEEEGGGDQEGSRSLQRRATTEQCSIIHGGGDSLKQRLTRTKLFWD